MSAPAEPRRVDGPIHRMPGAKPVYPPAPPPDAATPPEGPVFSDPDDPGASGDDPTRAGEPTPTPAPTAAPPAQPAPRPEPAPAPGDPPPSRGGQRADLPPIPPEFEAVRTARGDEVLVRRGDYVLVAGEGRVYLRDWLTRPVGPPPPGESRTAGESPLPAPAPAPASAPADSGDSGPDGLYRGADGRAWEVDTPLPDAADAVLAEVAEHAMGAAQAAGAGGAGETLEDAARRWGLLNRVRAKEEAANRRWDDVVDAVANAPGLRQFLDGLHGAVDAGLALGDWAKPGSRGVRPDRPDGLAGAPPPRRRP